MTTSELAAGLLYPVTGALLSPMIAAAAMALSSFSVVLNAARLNRFTPPPLPEAGQASTDRRPTPVGTSAGPSLPSAERR